MFGSKEKSIENKRVTDRNIVAKNTSLVGDIKSEGDFRIDGTLEGTIKILGRVIIGKNGFVKGTIEATNADIAGKFSGQLQVTKKLSLKSTANVSGDVSISELSIEPGATFNVNCAMKGAVKELKKEGEQQQKSEKTAS